MAELPPKTRFSRRRILRYGAAGAAAGTAGLLYGARPSFWHRFAREWSREILPPSEKPDPARWPDRGLYATWLGHATLLLKMDGFTILTDPVLGSYAGIWLGLFTLGIKRLVAPPLIVPELPAIDLVLLSHAHMDHFDIPTLRKLEKPSTTVVTAHATSDLLRVGRYRAVHELRWGQRVAVGPAEIRAVEVNHWGARMRNDTWRGYNGYVIEAGRHRVLFAGDTAITHTLGELRSSRPFDLAIMPIGAYNPWIRRHCTPEQAWRMGNAAGAEHLIPVHHRTFQLSQEPVTEPLERFMAAAGAHQDRVALQRIGSTWHPA